EHYENFPVASWLCPARLRAPIAAIYWFARTADDLADEGEAPASQRLEDLAQFRRDLLLCAVSHAHSGRWPQVFDPLALMIGRFVLPVQLLDDLLDAFCQDVVFTDQGRRYVTDAELHDYCRRSANPVGRLLLHLYQVDDALSLRQSDQICTALQLINFWQDLRGDIARARWYPSVEQLQAHQVSERDLLDDRNTAAASRLIATYVAQAWSLMASGAPLAQRLHGRAGWELRLVVQGGLRILEKIQAMQHATWRHRPRIGRSELPLLLWRAWRCPRPAPGCP
ncbi:MAG: squalene synthase HpnC, partial [Rhodoferax sp.]|nr:squalene synthase HpnC [Rhodoferax sp.]